MPILVAVLIGLLATFAAWVAVFILLAGLGVGIGMPELIVIIIASIAFGAWVGSRYAKKHGAEHSVA